MARAWLRLASVLDERGSTAEAAALRSEVLALLDEAPDDTTLAELVRAGDARDDLALLDEIGARVRSGRGAPEPRDLLATAYGRRGDVAAVAALVRAAGGWQAAAVTLRAGLAGLVARGVPADADAIERELLPLARGLHAAPGERWENTAHAAGAAVHAETVIATTLALLGEEARARALYEPLLAAAPSRDQQPIQRADRYAWCAAAAAAAGDPDARSLLVEADACIDRVDDDDDIDGYTARYRQRIDDARHQTAHLASMRGVPLGRRTLASRSQHVPLPASFRRFGEMNYAAERVAKLRVRIAGCAEVGLLGRALAVLAEAEADADVDIYQRSELVALAATALTSSAEKSQREQLVAAASRIPSLPSGRSPELPRSSALAEVARSLVRAGHYDEALATARRATAWHRRDALTDVALAMLAARRDDEARAVLEEIEPRGAGPTEPIDVQPRNDHDRYVMALVTGARRIFG